MLYGGMNMDNLEYTEKIICKKCKDISFRELEIQNLDITNSLEDKKPVYAVIIKKYQCPKCKSTEFISSLNSGLLI